MRPELNPNGESGKSPLHLRRLTEADLSFADSVRALAGWNQTRADWMRFLATEPDGCLLAEWNGTPAGTATTTVYGTTMAWIGMVLVHPDFRRRGMGTALLRRCLDYLREREVPCVKLDATPAGRPVYVELGFQDEWTLTRWAGQGIPNPGTASDPRVRPWQNTDLARVNALDVAAFGVSRERLLAALEPQSLAAMVSESASGDLEGYGFLRPGSRALYLGPVVAASAAAGLRLIEALVMRAQGQPIFWDIPDQNDVAVAWAQHHGLTRQRPLTRMFLGQNLAPGLPCQQLALAGPEVG